MCKKYHINERTLKNWEKEGTLASVEYIGYLLRETKGNQAEYLDRYNAALISLGKQPIHSLTEVEGTKETRAVYDFYSFGAGAAKPVNHQTGLKITVSYCQDNVEAQHDLQHFLINLSYTDVVADWHLAKVVSRRDWQDSTVKALNTSDVLIILMSPQYMAASIGPKSNKPPAIKNLHDTHCKIITVLVSDCDLENWQFWPVNELQALTGVDAKPDASDDTPDNSDIKPEAKNKSDAGKESPGQQPDKFEFLPLTDNSELQALEDWQVPEEVWVQLTRRLKKIWSQIVR